MSKGKILLEGVPEKVFGNRDTLIDNGLSVPEVTEIMSKLKKQGYDVNDGCFTVEDAAKEICRLLGK